MSLNALINREEKVVVACSGLKPQYRQLLQQGNEATLIYLKGDIETIWQRHSHREGHYFNGREMLESQFRELVEPDAEEAIRIDIDQSTDQVLNAILVALGMRKGGDAR